VQASHELLGEANTNSTVGATIPAAPAIWISGIIPWK
jgi:hypothetical protein